MKRILFALAVALPLAVLAASLTATWTNPTTNTDGTSIPASGIGSLTTATMTYGPCNAAGTDLASVTGTVPVAEPANSVAVPVLPPGKWCAFETVTNTYGNTSASSNVSAKTIAAPTPSAPSNFSW